MRCVLKFIGVFQNNSKMFCFLEPIYFIPNVISSGLAYLVSLKFDKLMFWTCQIA